MNRFIVVLTMLLVCNSNLLLAQKPIIINQQIIVNDSLNKVFEKVLYLNQYPEWSPFLEQDPTQKYEVKGNDGNVGAQYHWEGKKGKDLGYQEIAEIKSQSYIKMQCYILKPFDAQPVFEYFFEPTDNGILVTQIFTLKPSKKDAFFMKLFGVKKKMSRTNARGLVLLKESIDENNI